MAPTERGALLEGYGRPSVSHHVNPEIGSAVRPSCWS